MRRRRTMCRRTSPGRSARSLATRRRNLEISLPAPWHGESSFGARMAFAAQMEKTLSAPVGAILSVNNIEVIYDHVILVLKGVSLDVPKGGIVALLGANGAGKTTTLKAISNLLHAERGDVTKGSIIFEGNEVQDLSLIHISEPTRLGMISYAVFCLKKKKKKKQ